MWRFFHPLNKLKTPRLRTSDGFCNALLKTFQTNNSTEMYNLFLRGQSGQPIMQHDVDAAAMIMRGIAIQRIAEHEAPAKARKQEIEDLIDQLSEPFEAEKPDTKFLDKVIIAWGKIQKLGGKNAR